MRCVQRSCGYGVLPVAVQPATNAPTPRHRADALSWRACCTIVAGLHAVVHGCRLARTAMLTRAGIARPPHVLRFRFGLWKRKVQLHVAIEWFKLVLRAQRHLVQAISRWRTVASASMRLHGAVVAWEHTAEIRHARRPRPVRCLSGGWAAWRLQWQEAARQRERSRRALLHHEVHRVRRQ